MVQYILGKILPHHTEYYPLIMYIKQENTEYL